jgi:hypothetical protein
MILRLSDLPGCGFGELNALLRCRPSMAEPLQTAFPAERTRHKRSKRNKGVDMYATRAVNGIPAIQRNGQSVLSVCDQNWEFANWLCALLNELGQKSELLLNEQDGEWLRANHRDFRRAVQHA